MPLDTEDPFGRLDVDTHLVVVVGALDCDAVHAATDDGAQDLIGERHAAVAVIDVRLFGHGGHVIDAQLSRSQLTCADAATVFGAALALRCVDADLVQFDDSSARVQFRRP
ncbi:hypothetical protein ABN034_24420 [Actinopolymorpha sp. B11F2]|uniref:hypothetical protein n=1 Tax=Actinopolymorpha sp. B11F2 TaxID=3160862 RepID=UPI0032E5023F